MRRILILGLVLMFGVFSSAYSQDTAIEKTETTKEKTSKKDKSKKKKTAKSKSASSASNKKSKRTEYTPSNMWEFGFHGGFLFLSSDIAADDGWGGGMHIRKSMDYLVSLRADFLTGKATGANLGKTRTYTNKWTSVMGWGVFSLNSLRWDRPVRSTNVYAGFGVGINKYDLEFIDETPDAFIRMKDESHEIAPTLGILVGISLRVNKRFNFGLEHQVLARTGPQSDNLDGLDNTRVDASGNQQGSSIFGDFVQYPSIKLNFNIGNPAKHSEPLYWINPLDAVFKDISDLKETQDVSLSDSDNDGVIDAMDEEDDTPINAPVDTKGRTLDSDRDGVPDYRDKEPYYPPKAGEQVDENGVVLNPITRGGVSEQRVREMIDVALDNYTRTGSGPSGSGGGGGGGTIEEMFLPMIHFGSDSYTIKYSDYGTLSGIAKVIEGNASMRLVVTGFTDQTGPETINQSLSYQRAMSVVEHMMVNHGISRSRLVLQYKGQENALVPKSSSYMNRRVEFRVAKLDDYDMEVPSDYTSDSDGY